MRQIAKKSTSLPPCLLSDSTLKTEYIKLLQAIKTYHLDSCVAMLYGKIKVQVHMINTR